MRTLILSAAAAAAIASVAPRNAGAEATPETTRIGKLAKAAHGETLILAAPATGTAPAPERVAIQHVDGPSRIVIDVAGAVAEPKYQTLKIGQRGVKRARLATGKDGVRIVLDLAPGAALPEVKVDAVGGQLAIAISAPKAVPAHPELAAATPRAQAEAKVEARAEAKAEAKVEAKVAAKVEAKVEEKVEAKAEAKAVEPAKRDLGAVTNVRFEPKDGFLRLSVELSKDAVITKDAASTRRTPMLRVAGTQLPESLIRTLDTSAVAGKVVTAISTYNDGRDAIVAASVGPETEHRHWRKGNRLFWDFRSTVAPAATASSGDASRDGTGGARVLDYPAEATSGYQSEAADAASLLVGERQRYSGRRISLDLKDADIRNVLRLLADVSKLNVVAGDDVQGKITLKLRNVPWDQALDIILRAKQLDKTRNGNIIRVAPIDVLEKEEALRLQRKEASEKLEPTSVRLIPVSYAVAGAVKGQVQSLLSPRGKVNIDDRTNVLVVEDIAEVLLKVERLVRTLDTQTPQVLIEARIVEAATSFSRQLGIQWGGSMTYSPAFGNATGLQFPNTFRVSGASDDGNTPKSGVLPGDNGFAVNLPVSAGTGTGGSLGFVFGSASGAQLLSLRLTAAEQVGQTKIISAPKIVTLDNKKARILSGEKIPITVLTANGPSTRFVDANLELGVQPHVTSDGSVLLEIEAKKNELSSRTDLLGTPGILSREASTQMLVRDGDTAVLGGIYRRTAIETTDYVPFLGRIPVLGWLFKDNRRSDAREELLIFISPRIVNRSKALVSGR